MDFFHLKRQPQTNEPPITNFLKLKCFNAIVHLYLLSYVLQKEINFQLNFP